jgi:hypothetical protein
MIHRKKLPTRKRERQIKRNVASELSRTERLGYRPGMLSRMRRDFSMRMRFGTRLLVRLVTA